ncbi:glycosyltransferase family 4 protein [bacterium]|nr:glycosyltransferase family 4 protein [bacterium]
MITSIVMDPWAAPRASSIQNARTAAALAKLGHNVLLWHCGGKDKDQVQPVQAWFLKNFGTDAPPNLHFLEYTPHGERLGKKTPFFGLAPKMFNLARARFSAVGEPDVIITRSPLVLEQLRDRTFISRAKLVLEWQYPESVQLWRGWRKRFPSATMRDAVHELRALHRKELARLAYADGVLYAARDHERLLREAKYAGPAMMLGSACPDLADSIPQDAPEFDFGYSGGLARENGIELAIEALARLETGKLLLLGTGSADYVEHLRRRVAALNFGERVHFAGRVAPSQVRGWLERCRVGLVPISRRCGREKRQFASPLKLMEWLAAGVPTIAADVPSVSGLISAEQSLIIPADDAAALGEAMRRLNEDSALRTKLAQNGLSLANTMTFPNRAARIIDLASKIQI